MTEFEQYVAKTMLDPDVPVERKHMLVNMVDSGCNTIAAAEQVKHRPLDAGCRNDEMGYFGGIWVRKLFFPMEDTQSNSHAHDFDHVTLLATGSLKVVADGKATKVFTAPRFIVIRKGIDHQLFAEEPNTLAFCVHAFRNSSIKDHRKVVEQLKSEGIEGAEMFEPENDPLYVVID